MSTESVDYASLPTGDVESSHHSLGNDISSSAVVGSFEYGTVSEELGWTESASAAQEQDYAIDTPQSTIRGISTHNDERSLTAPISPMKLTQPMTVREESLPPMALTNNSQPEETNSDTTQHPARRVRVNEVIVQSQGDDGMIGSSNPSSASASTSAVSLPSPASADVPRFGDAGVYAALVGAQALWSGFHLFAKIAFDYMHPMVLPMIRAWLTTPCMFAICYSKDKNFYKIPKRDILQIALLGILVCCCCQNLFNLGLMLTTAADGGITQPAIPVFAALMAIVLKRESASLLKFCGIGCAIIGTACIVIGETYILPESDNNSTLASGQGGDSHVQENAGVTPGRRLLGIGCFMLQCFIFAIYLLVQKPILSRVPTDTVTFYTFLFGIPGTTLIGSYFAITDMDWAHLPPMWFVSIAYTIACASIGGFLLFAYATKYLPASASSMGVTMQPFFSSLLGSMILGEILTYMHVIGGIILIIGLGIVLWSRSKEAAQLKLTTANELQEIQLSPPSTQSLDDLDNPIDIVLEPSAEPSSPPLPAPSVSTIADPVDRPTSDTSDAISAIDVSKDAIETLKSRLSLPPTLPPDLDHNPAHIVIDDAVATGSSARRQSDRHALTLTRQIRAQIAPKTIKPLPSTKEHPRLGPATDDPFQ